MALTLSDIPDLALPGLRADFQTAYVAASDASIIGRLATIVDTSLPSQRYAFLGAPPAMREFVDERRPAGLASHAVSIDDRIFEATLAIDRRAIEDDQLGLVRMRIREMAERVALHRTKLVVETLVGGTGRIGYDGKGLLAADHPGPSGTVANVSASGLTAAGLSGAIDAMMGWTDDAGEPLGIRPDVLLVSPSLQWTAAELVESPVVVYRGDDGPYTNFKNALQGRLEVIASPYVPMGQWYVLDTTRPMRSVILQQRSDVPVEFTALDGTSGAEAAFHRDRYHYGVRARYGTGPGLWQTVYAGGRP